MKKAILSALILLFAAAAAVFFVFGASERKVVAALPLRGPAVQAVYATGTVEPSVMIPIAPRQTARLMSLMADEGHNVMKGQILGQLEDTDLAHTLDELKSKADLAQKQYDRAAALLSKKAIAPESAEQAQADLSAANAAVERVEAQLSYLRLLAPEDGIIIRRDGEVGEMIPASQPVFWMSCCAPLRIAAEVDEEDISLVKPGQEVVISADAFPDKVFKGTVQSITPKGDPVARSYRVRIGLEKGAPLMIGMTAETNIIAARSENALLVPAGALDGGQIWGVENGKARRFAVETGAKSAGAIEIKSGIDERSVIILEPSNDLEEGETIRFSLKKWSPE